MCEFFLSLLKRIISLACPLVMLLTSFQLKMNGWLGTIHQSLNRVDSLCDWLITVASVVSKLCECKFYHEPNDDSVS